MAPTNLNKALKAEVDALKNLRLLRNQATSVLDDTERLNHSEQIPQQYLLKLQEASQQYEASVRALVAVLENEEQIGTYTTRLTKQLGELDILTKKLRAAVGNTHLEDVIENSSQIDKNNKQSSRTCK